MGTFMFGASEPGAETSGVASDDGEDAYLSISNSEIENIEEALLQRLANAEQSVRFTVRATIHDIEAARKLRDRYDAEYRRVLARGTKSLLSASAASSR